MPHSSGGSGGERHHQADAGAVGQHGPPAVGSSANVGLIGCSGSGGDPANAAATSGNGCSWPSVWIVGGSIGRLPVESSASAAAGVSQLASSASPETCRASWPTGSAAAKNLVS